MKRNIFLIIILLLAAAIFLFFYLGKGREDFLSSGLKDAPDTPVNEICQSLTHSDNIDYCLAVANQDEDYCQDLDIPSEKNLCRAMATRDISYCREIKEAEPKQVCYYELSFLAGEFDYCREMENSDMCYFAFLYRLHWEARADEIKAEYCDKFNADAPDGQIFKTCCLAFRAQDPALCQGNKYCLSFFKQPLSFCDSQFNIPGGGPISDDECLLHRALSGKDASICAQIGSAAGRDGCYADMSTHISPDLSFCDQVVNGMVKDMCYTEFAINSARQE